MAKGNLFLGTARRSVGDVVMYRREGSQVSRVRVRKIANPRTDAQSMQRAAFSPVAKFYSPLATVLERSWEGKNRSQSYSAYLKENVKQAKANGWLLPKGTGFFPLPYKLSNGTLPSQFYSVAQSLQLDLDGLSADITTIGALSTVFINNGLKDGDIVTFIVVEGLEEDVASSNFVPRSAQFLIDSTSIQTIEDAFKGFTPVRIVTDTIFIGYADGPALAAGAIIVARYENEKWRRSTQALAVNETITRYISTATFHDAAIASYGNSASGDNPLVYLDGEELTD